MFSAARTPDLTGLNPCFNFSPLNLIQSPLLTLNNFSSIINSPPLKPEVNWIIKLSVLPLSKWVINESFSKYSVRKILLSL